jgi:hypothetical protein
MNPGRPIGQQGLELQNRPSVSNSQALPNQSVPNVQQSGMPRNPGSGMPDKKNA